MFWVLDGTISLRWFFWVPTTYVLVEKQHKYFCYTLNSRSAVKFDWNSETKNLRTTNKPAKSMQLLTSIKKNNAFLITVYRRKRAYLFKTAFPEPYLLQKMSLSAKNKLSDRQWHQKVSKIISYIYYMKKMAMQRNNREAIRQKSNSHTLVNDADFL